MSQWREIVESYDCPTCGAKRGERCITHTGNEFPECHAARGGQAIRCRRCRGRLPADAEYGDLCDRCAQVRALEVERATYHVRRDR